MGGGGAGFGAVGAALGGGNGGLGGGGGACTYDGVAFGGKGFIVLMWTPGY